MTKKHNGCYMCGMEPWRNIKNEQPEAGEDILGCWMPTSDSLPDYIAGMAFGGDFHEGGKWYVTDETETFEIHFWAPIIKPDWSTLQ